jgi:hypothetical protein
MRWLGMTGGLLVLSLAACAKNANTVAAKDGPVAAKDVAAPADVRAPSSEPPAGASMGSATGSSTTSTEETSTNAPLPPLPSCGLKATVRDLGSTHGDARFVLTLKNESSKPVRLVLPGDGSEVGWRTPALTWSATSGSQAVSPAPSPRCGMMNHIEPAEIITLAPGASREMTEWIPPPPFTAGTYDLRLTYRNDPKLAAKADRGDSDEVKRLVEASSACEVTTTRIRATL